MRADAKYSLIAALGLFVLLALGLFLSSPLLYTLEKDTFPSRFHDNTDVLKMQSLNSTTDVLPLMQDLLDSTGPIVLNIRINDIEQARRDLELFAKSRGSLNNLIVKLDMSGSEIEEFSKSKDLQQNLLMDLLNSSISLDALENLEIRYRDQNNPDMLISVQYQGDALRKKVRELYEQYNHVTDQVVILSERYGLDTREEKQSIVEFTQLVQEIEKKQTQGELPVQRTPQLSFLIKPDKGTYLDIIDLSGVYLSDTAGKTNYPVTIFIDNYSISSVSTDEDGMYHSTFQIERIPAGLHPIYATSGLTSSVFFTLNVTPIHSTTSLKVQPVYNKPEVRCTGIVMANKPVRNASVDLLSDYRNALRLTTNITGGYQTQIRFSPGIHRLEARFVNDTYPVFSSQSPVYEITATPNSITSIRIIDTVMDADDITLTIDPIVTTYKDTIALNGTLSGRNPGNKKIDVFIDGTYRTTVHTGPEGSYATTYSIDRIPAGTHTIFTHYSEPDKGEIFSQTRSFGVKPVDSITLLDVELTDGDTALICYGNVTANARWLSSVPLELVWDNRNVIDIQTDAAGSFRQKVSLPFGKHRIFARFTPRDYPVNPSASAAIDVELKPPIDLFVTPDTVQYMDSLTIGGSLRGVNTTSRSVRVLIDGTTAIVTSTDKKGEYKTGFTIERIPGGPHSVQAFSGDFMSSTKEFRVQPVNSQITLNVRKMEDTSRVICSGRLTAGPESVQNAPVMIIWDEHNFIETRTDAGGNFDETFTLPAGTHRIKAQFNSTDTFPINPSESPLIHITIPEIFPYGNVTLTISPNRGVFGDTLDLSGQLSSKKISDEDILVYIDSKTLGRFKTNTSGIFKTRYTIERIPAGIHTTNAVSGDFRSDIQKFEVLPVDSEISLTLRKIQGTSTVVCSGTVTARNKSVRFAPVKIIWDNGTMIKTETRESGSFEEVITLAAGKHRMRAQFNSSESFPLSSSESAPADIEISPSLSLHVTPGYGIYKDRLTFDGVLTRPYQMGGYVDIFLDNKNITTLNTDSSGQYRYPLVIERLADGQHVVQARSGEISSDRIEIQIHPVRSRTSLTVTRINHSALFACNGMVMAFDRPGTIIRIPDTLQDVLDILATFWNNPLDSAKRPVSLAPVHLVLDNETITETRTDMTGTFSAVVSLPEGKHRIFARFINSSYPIMLSQSNGVDVDVAGINLTLQTFDDNFQIRIFEPVVAVLIILVFTGGAVFYLKRKSLVFTQKKLAGEDKDIPPPAVSHEVPPSLKVVPDQDLISSKSLFQRYLRVLNRQGMSIAAWTVYLHFTGLIAGRLHIARHRTLTPREFLRSCDEKPFVGAFSSFISIYERIRYGGASADPDKEKFEDTMKNTETSLEGDHD